jgi:hypothetical protein
MKNMENPLHFQNLFDELTEDLFPSTVPNVQQKNETVDFREASPSNFNENDNLNTFAENILAPNSINEIHSEQQTDNSVVYVQYHDMKAVINDLKELKLANALLTNNLQKITAQNDVMMQMMTEFCKKKPADTSFVAVTNITSKEELDEFEEKLKDDQYKNNTVNLVL